MDIRLALPVLMLLAALSLAGGVHRALSPLEQGFHLEPAGPVAGAWTALTMAGPYGSSPQLRWSFPSGEKLGGFALLAEDLDAPAKQGLFWGVWGIAAEQRALPPGLGRRGCQAGVRQARIGSGDLGYLAPGLAAATGHRLRFTLFALREKLVLPAGVSIVRLREAIAREEFASTSWCVGGGWSLPAGRTASP